MNIEELKRLAEAATPGPWRAAGEQRNYVDAPIGHGLLQEVAWCGDCQVGNKAGNAAYIAAANPATVLKLIAEVERVTKQRDELLATAKQAVDRIAYAIYNLADKKLEELPAGIIDSTDPVYSGLIAEKFLRAAIAKNGELK